MNHHILVNFIDGVAWLCCIRHHHIASTPVAYYIESTDFERSRDILIPFQIPVPKIHDCTIDYAPKLIGVGYTPTDKLDGKAPSDCDLSNDDRKCVLSQISRHIYCPEALFYEIGCFWT
jgi:hypothetical protein